MQTRIGTCSLCGGDVMAYQGAWNSVLPPPPPTCNMCGAVMRGYDDIIDMVPRRFHRQEQEPRWTTTDGTGATW